MELLKKRSEMQAQVTTAPGILCTESCTLAYHLAQGGARLLILGSFASLLGFSAALTWRLRGQIHKLQMLMRMAEITKLEEYVKCSRRYDAVREEKLGLLTYNLASAESNMAPESDEATRKRLMARSPPPLPLTLPRRPLTPVWDEVGHR